MRDQFMSVIVISAQCRVPGIACVLCALSAGTHKFTAVALCTLTVGQQRLIRMLSNLHKLSGKVSALPFRKIMSYKFYISVTELAEATEKKKINPWVSEPALSLGRQDPRSLANQDVITNYFELEKQKKNPMSRSGVSLYDIQTSYLKMHCKLGLRKPSVVTHDCKFQWLEG